MSLEIEIKTRTEKRHGIKMSNPSPSPVQLPLPTPLSHAERVGRDFKFILGIEFVGMSQRDNFSISASLAGNHLNYLKLFPNDSPLKNVVFFALFGIW